MKRAVLSLFAIALCATAVAATHASTTVSEMPDSRPLPARMSVTRTAAGAIERALVLGEPGAGGDDDHEAVRRRVRLAEAGTYIGEILLERDSALSRWGDRHGAPISVWVQPISAVNDFTGDYVGSVRAAFEEWNAVRLPVRFALVSDSASADVHVTFIDHFNEPISGRTRWARDDAWLITDANILLAVHHYQGELLDIDSMRAMALHEIGHLLGLDHTTDSMSIMAPRVRVRALAPADRATARLLYSLPPGPLR